MKYTITVNLKELLKQKNISQKELSKMTGIREVTISEIVRNTKTGMNYSHFEKIAEALNVQDINELLKLNIEM